jgi:thiamine-phosphate pyrophosphorylase
MKERFGLYLILTDPAAGYETAARAAVKCSVRYLQLRMKNVPWDEYLATARQLRDISRETCTRLIINDNLDIAMEVDADGIHLGQGDLSLEAARQRWNVPGKIFGLSTHNMAQMQQAAKLRPDYIGIGPVFSTQTKTLADPVLGIEETARIAHASPVPSAAIGGINASNLPRLLQSGVENFCVISAVNRAVKPEISIKKLQKIWHSCTF